MATYTFDKPWPKRVIRRNVKVYPAGSDKPSLSTTISPPQTVLDIGDFPEGTRIRIEFTAVEQGNRTNKEKVVKEYVIPDLTDVEDDPSGVLTVNGETVPEAGPEDTSGDNPMGDDGVTTGGAVSEGNPATGTTLKAP